MAGNWFQQIQRENKNDKDLVPTNTAGNRFQPILREICCGKQFQPKRRDIGYNQYNRKLVPTNTAGKAEQQGIDSYQYGEKIDSKQYSGKYFAQKSYTQYVRKWENWFQPKQGIPTNTAGKWFRQMQWEIHEIVTTNTACV